MALCECAKAHRHIRLIQLVLGTMCMSHISDQRIGHDGVETAQSENQWKGRMLNAALVILSTLH